MPHHNLLITDYNSEERSVKKDLKQRRPIPRQMYTVAGCMKTGGFPDLDGERQKTEKGRILLGNEMTKRTKGFISNP